MSEPHELDGAAPAPGIAIVGMAGRFPGAPDLARFWENLAAGVESIAVFGEAELRAAGVPPELLADPAYVRSRALVEGAELFDAALFGFSPREAEVLDPQHRLLLECAWEALERAGYDPARYAGPVGVFAGAGMNSYLLHNLLPSAELARTVGAYQGMLASGGDFLATRVSYKLGLRGPSLTVQTACSTSLVAVHLAVQSLLLGECDMALAGGVRISVPQAAGYLYQPGGILSPDGHCRPFDAAAQGTVDGDGVGVVVLKRLADARAEGDRVLAVILGSAVNNDGDLKIGFTAPSAEGQAEVVAMAQALAGVDQETITYLEAHGTGTPLGDPIEVAALRRAFPAGRSGFCALGSVKGNIGHLDAAAGVAALIKTVLALQHRQIPPSLHFAHPNPQLDLAGSPFYVNARLAEWPAAGAPRRAGVSSFGIGGTNAHLVLEEAPAPPPAGGPARPSQLLLLSAATASALEAATANLVDHLRHRPADDLADVAYTLQVGRRVLPHRRMVVCRDVGDAVAALGALDPKRVLTRVQERVSRGVAFLFPGQGGQHPGMAAELYRAEPSFRRRIDLSCELLRPHLGFDLRPLLFPAPGAPAGDDAERLRQTAVAQPALFVVEHALAGLWMEWGIVPEAMLGHSIGEYVAACLAGVFPLEDALRLVAARGRLMQELPTGAMLSVALGEAEVRGLLADGLALAAVNAPALCVVSGAAAAVEDLAARLEARGVRHRRLQTSHAFHSPAMEPAMARFAASFAGIRLSPPALPFLSNLTGTWIRPEEAVDPEYWTRHLRHTVRFAENLEVLFRKPATVLLEVGPGRALGSLARQHPARSTGQGVLASLPPAPEAGDDLAHLLRTLGQLWLAGVEVSWDAFHAGGRRRRVELPAYPFERRRYWVEPAPAAAAAARRDEAPQERRPLDQWFYVPLWRQTLPSPPAPGGEGAEPESWLVFTGETGLGEALAVRLADRGHRVVRVRPGERFARLGERRLAVRPGEAEDYRTLLDELAGAGLSPTRIAHLWNVDGGEAGAEAGAADPLELGFHSLMALARALGERPVAGTLRLGVVATGLHRVAAGEALEPLKATLLGPVLTIPQEYPGVTCQSFDVALPAPGSRRERELIDLLLAELGAPPTAPAVAYRGTERWVRDWAPAPLSLPPAAGLASAGAPPLRAGGTYLITGGLGGVGLEVAALLARSTRVRLVLLGRTAGLHATAETHRRLRELAELGAEVLVVAADVADRASLASALDRARERFGPLHGVVHAAGVAGGGLIQRRERRESEAVLAPKVAGTLHLAEQVAGEPLDFLVLCSSLNALAGGPGQADYAAANAFLDAFAQAAAGSGELPVVAVDWDAWREVGMAAGAAGAGAPAPEPPLAGLRPFAHPLLRERGAAAGGAGEVFVARLRPGETWVLDEHRLGGHPVVPGTVYLEMAAAAFRGALEGDAEGEGRATEIRDVLFVAPLAIADGEGREVHTLLRPEGEGYRFAVRSGAPDAGPWQEHAVGSIALAPREAPARFDLPALLAGGREETMGEAYREDLRAAGLGPRWETLRKVWVKGEGVVGLLELAPGFAADLAAFRLHPALLDAATCFAEAYVPRGDGYYLPLSYRRLRIAGALPARLYSYARLGGGPAGGDGRRSGVRPSVETLVFDLSLLDEEGVERVRIDEFTLKRVDVAATLRARSAAGPEPAAAAAAADAAGPEAGMSPAEGVETLRRILAHGRSPQVAVSTHDLPALLARARRLTAAELAGKLAGAAGGGYARPDLDTPYLAPRTPLEERLAALWQEVLGVQAVGVHDDFFELGGHSLLGTQLIARVRDELHAELPIARLFAAPTVAELAVVLAPLAGEATAAPAPIPRAPEGDAPLSFSQERLWFLDQMDVGNPFYNISQAVRVTGALDVAAVARSVEEIVRRHEILRTAFAAAGGRPVQRVLPAAGIGLPVVDLTALPPAQRERRAERLASRAAMRSFDLARPPLLAVELYRVGPESHVLTLTLHHIVADGWSIVVFLAEFAALYRAFHAGEPSPLPPLPLQYGDFARWQRERLGREESEAQLAYWRRQLRGPLPALDLPTDRPRPAVQTFQGASELLTLPAEVTSGLKALCHREGATPFMGLLAALLLVLHRWSGQDDLLVGSPIAGRDRRELEELIGIFLNTLVLRVDLAAAPTFRELLGRVRQTAIDAYARQEVPIERLIAELQPERDLSRTPLFQVLFNMQDFPARDFSLPGLTLTTLPVRDVPAKFDLTLYAAEVEGEILCELIYNAGLFDRDTALQILAQLRHLLPQAIAAPAESIARFSLVPPETARLLPDPRAPLPAGVFPGAAHERFAAQARRVPDRLALIAGEEVWTYARLAAASDRLARRLAALGVGEGEVVAVYAGREARLVQAVLGVMTAGAAFLILDPAYPPARLLASLEQARPGALVTAAEPPPEVAGTVDAARRIDLRALGEGGDGGDGADGADGAAREPWPAGEPGDLAYVAFTSGSTGRPKGILGAHGPLSHFLAWHVAEFGLGEADRFSLLSGLAHDPLLRDLLTPLWLGATLCIPDPDDLGSPARLAAWMARQAITVCHLTPPLGRVMTAGPPEAALPDLRWAFFGGDALLGSDVDRLRALAPGVRCVNFYGTTETPQAMSWYVPGPRLPSGRRLPVGHGIDGVQLLVLNAADQLAGVGEVGEVHVRTPYLSLGYLGEGSLTRERFVTNPATGEAGDRLYRTGDLGRFRPDGTVDLAGRRDRQLKVRGFRIEPGEIEAALARLPAVREAVAVLRGGAPAGEEGEAGRRGVWAYLVPPPGMTELPGDGELRAALRGSLPEAMLPAGFVWLERLPLTPNGKVDAAALPDPAVRGERGGAALAAAAPRTPTEQTLAGFWAALLGLERAGIHDDFFALGGHSLLATQLVSQVREAFQVDLPLRLLFQAPTVAAFAPLVDAARRAAGEGGRPDLPLVALPRHPDAELPLSFAQERLWFLDQLQPGLAVYILPAAVHLGGALSVEALEWSFGEVVRRHEALRTRFPSREGRATQAIAPHSPFPLARIDLSGLPAEARAAEAARRAAEESRRAFDLAAGPLLRGALLRLDAREHLLLVALHHIVADGWSLGVLVRELGAGYAGFRAGEAPPLPALPVQYADYAAWQRRWLSGEVLEVQLAYWRRQLADLPGVELPADRPRPAVATFRGGERPFGLRPELRAAVERLGRETGATTFMVLLAAFATLLLRYTGQEDLPVGAPIAGRTRRETEPLIGLFVNTLVLRGDLAGDPTVPALLERVRRTALDAYAHQDLPFEKVVDALQTQRDLSRAPLVQVLFNLRNAPRETLHVPGLELAYSETRSGAVSFDLELSLAETREEVAGAFHYSSDLFDAATIGRLAEHFGNLLEGMVAGPDLRLSALPLLSAAERGQLLGEATDLGAEEPPVHVQIARQAARAPEAVALSWKEERLTYGDLDRRADALAHRLRALGVGAEARVGLLLERSPELVIGLLAIWKAGGAFLPLDPDHPQERLDLLLADSGARWAVTRRALAGRLPDGVAGIAIEDVPPAGRAAPPEWPPVEPASLAYVIYTSGSTGRPKGVLVEHGNLSRLLQATRRELGWSSDDVMPCLAKPSFDIFLFELLSPLAAGGTSVLVPLDPVPDLEEVVTLLGSCTRLHAVPALMRQIVDWARLRGAAARRLRTLFVGGDAVPVELLRDLREVFPRAEVRVLYGPTEGTVLATSHRVEPRPERTLIGRPFPGMQAVLKDRAGNLVPVGVAGEIHLGGVGVTRGYLDREELTRERYVLWEGERWYRTGDLARRLPGGELEFLGRADDQVKVRGVRVEPGEVEAALAGHPKVREGAVVAWGPAGDRRLAAFVVPRDGEILAGEELRGFLRGRLPEAMVPATFEALAALPLTAHDKVDRRALAAQVARTAQPAAEKGEAAAGPAAPTTLAEAALARIWAAVLRRETVGVHDNFFELGGDSILSIQIVAQASQAGLRITPRQMFEHQTVAALAAAAGRVEGTLAEQGPVTGPVPLTPIQRRFLAADPPEPHHFNQAVLLRPRGLLAPRAVERAFAALLVHHDALRLRFLRAEDGWRQAAAPPGGETPFLRLDLSALAPAASREALERAAGEAQASLDLAAGPLARAVWFDLPRGEARLLLVVHHLAVDGVSWRILLEDLETALRHGADGEAALPAKTTSFRRWAERLVEHARMLPLEPELSGWLAAGEEGAPLPLDGAGENTTAGARTVSFSLSAEETRGLLEEVPQAYRTQINTALLAALVRTLAGPDGTLRVEIEGHGREEIGEGIDLSRTVGWLTTAYPVRLAVAAGGDPGTDLRAVKEQLRAVPDRGIGYGLLRYLRGDGAAAALLAGQPPPAVGFNYLGQLDQAFPEESLFLPADEAAGAARSPRQEREQILAVTGWVAGSRLRIDLTYGAALHRRATVERWADELASRLRELIAHCVAPGAGGYTPSDFDKVMLRQEDLDNLLAELEEMVD